MILMKRKFMFSAVVILIVSVGIITLAIYHEKTYEYYTGAFVTSFESPVALVDGTVIYNTNDPGNDIDYSEKEYYRKYFDGRDDVKLGTMYNFRISAGYNARIDNTLYFYSGVVNETGEIDNNFNNNLYGIDLTENTMRVVYTDNNVRPIVYVYPYMNKVLALKTMPAADNASSSFLELYDPKTGSIKTVLTHTSKSADKTGSRILTCFPNDEKVYTFVTEYNAEGEQEATVRVYNQEFQCIQTISFDKDLMNYILGSRPHQIAVFGDYIYLDNLSNYSLVGKIENDTVTPVVQARSLEVAVNRDTDGRILNTQVFYIRYTNTYYILDIEKGTFTEKEYDQPFENHTLLYAMANSDKIIIYSWIYELDENTAYSREEASAAHDGRYVFCNIKSLK
jgi:hypothetical protein